MILPSRILREVGPLRLLLPRARAMTAAAIIALIALCGAGRAAALSLRAQRSVSPERPADLHAVMLRT